MVRSLPIPALFFLDRSSEASAATELIHFILYISKPGQSHTPATPFDKARVARFVIAGMTDPLHRPYTHLRQTKQEKDRTHDEDPG